MQRIKRDDKVRVLSGKERGRTAKVLKIIGGKGALVERLNIVKRHVRAGAGAGKQGGIVDKEAPIKLDKLMVVCPKCSKPARTGVRTLEDGKRVRYCKKCSEQIDT